MLHQKVQKYCIFLSLSLINENCTNFLSILKTLMLKQFCSVDSLLGWRGGKGGRQRRVWNGGIGECGTEVEESVGGG